MGGRTLAVPLVLVAHTAAAGLAASHHDDADRKTKGDKAA